MFRLLGNICKNATESLVVGFDGRMMTATMAEEIESIKTYQL